LNDPKHLMDEEITGLKSLLRSLAEETHAEVGEHLNLEKIEAYHFGELSSDEAEMTQEHLVKCHQCASRLLDFAEFCDSEEDESSRPSEKEVEGAWGKLQAQLGTVPRVSGSSQSLPASGRSWFQRLGELIFPQRLAYALAALLSVVSLALVVWIMSLEREKQNLVARLNEQQGDRAPVVRNQDDANARKALAEAERAIEETKRQRDEERLRVEQLEKQAAQLEAQRDQARRDNNVLIRPQPNAPVVELNMDGSSRGTNEPPRGGQVNQSQQSIELPAGTTRFTLSLPSPSQELNYTLEIVNSRGIRILNAKGLRSDSKGGLTIALSSQLLPPGQYRFIVYSVGRGSRKLELKSDIRITYK
jgi:anti-sigma factor RsiW